jgi:hypothetical protein
LYVSVEPWITVTVQTVAVVGESVSDLPTGDGFPQLTPLTIKLVVGVSESEIPPVARRTNACPAVAVSGVGSKRAGALILLK